MNIYISEDKCIVLHRLLFRNILLSSDLPAFKLEVILLRGQDNAGMHRIEMISY